MKSIALIGSSGVIGSYVQKVVSEHSNEFCIRSMAVYQNTDSLLNSIYQFSPAHAVVVSNSVDLNTLKNNAPVSTKLSQGKQALIDLVTDDKTDIVVAASSDITALEAVEAALRLGKTVALANKEVMVCGGEIISKIGSGKIIPVDSEHSAIFQALHCGERKDVRRIILTASGGTFYGKTISEFYDAPIETTLKHPNWYMGKKITVDSATMMNKGLEIIEARWLFDTQNIDYVIHPQSVIHSMVEYNDNSVIAQMSYPSMEIPVLLALSYPKRYNNSVKPLDFYNLKLDFLPPDEENFPCPVYAKEALKRGGLCPTVINAADQEAVELYLAGKIKLGDIVKIIEYALGNLVFTHALSIENIIKTDSEVKEYIKANYNKIIKKV